MKKPQSSLTELIQAHILSQGGRIRFQDYMQLALYTPGLGYYSGGKQKFGRGGDFITAPEIGSNFAKCIATQCRQVFKSLAQKNILEIGAGSGKLAADLTKELGNSLDNYYILEISSELQQRQKANVPAATWLYNLPENFTGVIIANEVMDAMPVARFYYSDEGLQEYYVNNKLAFEIGEPNKMLLQHFAKTNLDKQLIYDYSSEVNLWIPGWIKSLYDCLQKGLILLFDYGFPRKEYYHPDRADGTLMCHHQHKSHCNPFYLPGEQDITAHIDFTSVAEASDCLGLEIGGYTNLAGFLLNSGLIDEVDTNDSAEINTLTSPAEMGELFKAIGLTKNFREDLLGFTEYDRTHTL